MELKQLMDACPNLVVVPVGAPAPKSWKPQIATISEPNRFYDNSLRFATKEEAEASAKDIYGRWMLAHAWRAVESDDAPNYQIVDGVMIAVAKEN